jgi:hypothetical protein
MAIFQKTILDSTSPNSFATSTMPMMQHIGEFTLRSGNRYLDIKTNLITTNAMLSFYYWGYLYNNATCFGHAGCYPYDGTTIINKYIYNTGATILTNIYKMAAPYNLCLKFDRGNSEYSEGKINVFISIHGLNLARVDVTSFIENNTAGQYY